MKSYIAIILGVSAIILIYVIYLLIFKSSSDTLLSSPIDFLDSSGNVKGTVIDSKLITNISSSNYAISCWVCVNNWTKTPSNGKTIYGLIKSSDKNFAVTASFDNSNKPDSGSTNTSNYPIFPWNDISSSFPTLFTDVSKCYYTLALDSTYPNLYFTILARVPGSSNTNTPQSYPIFITDNFPIQKWTNVIISMEGNQLDAYIDGKLIQSGPIAYLDSSGNQIKLTKDPILKTESTPTFIVGNSKETNVDISVTTLSIHSRAIDPQSAYSIYRYGSGVSTNRTKVNVSLSENNNVFRDIKLI